MRALILTIFIAIYFSSGSLGQDCLVPDLKRRYQKSIHSISVPAYKAVAAYSNVNFVFTVHSIWIMLAAIAEGSDAKTQHQLFRLLNLPAEQCIRQKFYQIASTRAIADKDISVTHTRALFIDEGVVINPAWHTMVTQDSLLNVVTVPIKSNPIATEDYIKQVMDANVPRLNLTGNSVLLDAINYGGLWSTAFADAVIERSPFYSQEGDVIGSVDLMKVKRRAKIGYMKSVNAKILELPIGSHSRHCMLFVVVLEKKPLSWIIDKVSDDIIMEMFNSLKQSRVLVDIAIPRMEVTGEVDMRTVIEELGIRNIWTDPEATKYISNPSALPSSYVQRATITINKHGVAVPTLEQDRPGTRSGLDPEVGTEFIANQPFLFGLFDTESLTPLIAVGYSKPTYS